jgi:D-serine deaminase-like pyridoxal phosphate-dependent protein
MSPTTTNYFPSPLPALHKQFLHQKLPNLPTPAVFLDRAVVKRNCDVMLQVCEDLGLGFRAHVKSHKVRR